MTPSAIIALAGTAFNGFNALMSARKARQRQREALRELDAGASAQRRFYNKQLYDNYFDKADTKNAIREVNDNLDRQRQLANGASAVTGATEEAKIAKEASLAKAGADAVAGIAAQGARRKDSLLKAYADAESRYADKRAALKQREASNNSMAMSNALGAMPYLAQTLAMTMMPATKPQEAIGGQGGATAPLDMLKDNPETVVPAQ